MAWWKLRAKQAPWPSKKSRPAPVPTSPWSACIFTIATWWPSPNRSGLRNANELEITDLNRAYFTKGKLKVQILGRGFAWLDTGTHESLVNATMFIKTVEDRQDLKIACIEEIAFKNGWIGREQLKRLAQPLQKSGYGSYLMRVADEQA